MIKQPTRNSLFVFTTIAILVMGTVVGLYLPKVVDKVQAYQTQKLIETNLERLDNIQSEWKDLEDKQEQLHREADYIREFLSDLGYNDNEIASVEGDMNEKIIDCFEYTGNEYNLCLGDIIQEQYVAIEENKGHGSAEIKFLKKDFARDDGRQAYVNYAYQIGGKDLVYLIECENANRDMYRQSEVVKNGKREESYGFCQIHKKYYKDIVNNDNFWNDWKWQLDKCNELMKNGTPFYGRNRKINGVKCSEYVADRFYFE